MHIEGFRICGRTHLVHDNIVDGVLINVLVVAKPHREALWVISLKVLQTPQHHQHHDNTYCSQEVLTAVVSKQGGMPLRLLVVAVKVCANEMTC